MKGILFKPDMIKAIVEDRKTQTRRIMKPQPDADYGQIFVGTYCPTKVSKYGEEYPGDEIFGAYTEDGNYGWLPRYQVGEVVYIKEAHYRHGFWSKEPKVIGCNQVYNFVPMDEDKFPIRFLNNPPDTYYKLGEKYALGYFKRSPLFLPEKYARDFLQITAVRAERLQDISGKDAVAEGVNTALSGGDLPKIYYMELWDSINKKNQWASNPWVWVYTFKAVPR